MYDRCVPFSNKIYCSGIATQYYFFILTIFIFFIMISNSANPLLLSVVVELEFDDELNMKNEEEEKIRVVNNLLKYHL